MRQQGVEEQPCVVIKTAKLCDGSGDAVWLKQFSFFFSYFSPLSGESCSTFLHRPLGTADDPSKTASHLGK